MKLTERAAESLSRLRGNPDFTNVLGWLAEIEKQTSESLNAADNTTVIFRLQGYGKALRDLAKANTEAPDTVERFKRPGGQGTT